MEATILSSPCKRVRNPKRGTQTGSLIPSRTYTKTTTTPNLYHSESLSRLNSLQFPQPPLLPLPMPHNPRHSRSLPTSGSPGNSLSPVHKKHSKNKKVVFVEDKDEEEKFSGSAFSLAPPPSSLPMPKLISLKPKVSCKVEAICTRGGFGLVDTGATDNLCRLLNIR